MFPTLPIKNRSFTLENNVLETQFDSGRQLKRKKFTKTRRIITLSFSLLSESEKEALEAFFNTNGLHNSFQYTYTDIQEDPLVVFFTKPIKLKKDGDFPEHYTCDDIELKEK